MRRQPEAILIASMSMFFAEFGRNVIVSLVEAPAFTPPKLTFESDAKIPLRNPRVPIISRSFACKESQRPGLIGYQHHPQH